jgi:peroxiredoxin
MNSTRSVALALACLNIILLFFYTAKKRELKIVAALYRSGRALAVTIPKFTLPDNDGKPFDGDEVLAGAEFTLFVFLSPSDCSPCLAEIELWRQLASTRDGLSICAITRHTNALELRQWIDSLDLNFLVLCDDGGRLTEEFGVLTSPFKVLADSKGRILLKEGPAFDKVSQKAFIRRLDGILDFDTASRKTHQTRVAGAPY